MPSDVFYAHIDKVEFDDESLHFEFHCIEKHFADNILDYPMDAFRNVFREYRSQVIALTNTPQNIARYFPIETMVESNWVALGMNADREGLEAQLFVEDEEAVPQYINSIAYLPEDNPTRQLLEEKISLDGFPDAEEEEIKTVIEKAGNVRAEFVSVYDVGQGNSNAVCDSRSLPLLYFDLGGGCYTNRHTYPSSLNFCFTNSPAIILSHWDTDHYQSARLDTRYRQQSWIVPRQKIGPVHFRFFLDLHNSGNVYIWPLSLSRLYCRWGEIVLCNGPAKNHSGLAFLVDINPVWNGMRRILLPADAAYTYIPGIADRIFDGLVCTHHGANFDHNNAPVVLSHTIGAIAYSYGMSNSYGHPKNFCVTAHLTIGWTSVLETPQGHIAFTDCSIPALPCGGAQCQLQIKQRY